MSQSWMNFKKLQPIVLRMLENSIKKNRVAHAYIFEGDQGTGKKEAAILFSKILFCEEADTEKGPCEACVNCKRIANGNHPDLHLVEPDGLSIKKQQISDLQKEFSKTAVESTKKIYIVVHADKMTTGAANSLLKFLEEPHSDTIAILITEQIHRMLPTIISRSQTLSFKPLPPSLIKERLIEENISPVLAALACRITNNLHEAKELCNDDQFAQLRKIVLKLYEVLQKNSLEAMIKLQEDFNEYFKDKQQVDRALDLLLLIFKDLLSLQAGKETDLAFPDRLEAFKSAALHLSAKRLTEQMTAILEAKRRLSANMNPQLLMEQLVLNLQGGSAFV
ncbi:MAG TPA: DNA polymerase III subunit delta' [Chondromyces sp.]|nr:DNA polymerase III subunit delta' [Chondromyces sp.]